MLVPAGELDFAGDGSFVWMSAQDVEGDTANDGDVLRGIVFSGSGLILMEADVELPVEFVFDAPMSSCDFQQPGRRKGGRQGYVAGRLLDLVAAASLGLDAADRNEAWEGGGVAGARPAATSSAWEALTLSTLKQKW